MRAVSGRAALLGAALLGAALVGLRYRAVPVAYHASGPDDPCGTVSVVVDGGAVLRRAPSPLSAPLARLPAEQWVLVCAVEGEWAAAVVREAGADCAPAPAPAPAGRQRYRGPCLSGWIAIGALRLLAG